MIMGGLMVCGFFIMIGLFALGDDIKAAARIYAAARQEENQ